MPAIRRAYRGVPVPPQCWYMSKATARCSTSSAPCQRSRSSMISSAPARSSPSAASTQSPSTAVNCSMAATTDSRKRSHSRAGMGALRGGRSPSSRSKRKSTYLVKSAVSSRCAARWSSTCVCWTLCVASWPMNPLTSAQSSGSLTSGRPSLRTFTNQRSPAGSSRCSTLMTWVAVGSPGIQCRGVRDQSKDTRRGAISWLTAAAPAVRSPGVPSAPTGPWRARRGPRV